MKDSKKENQEIKPLPKTNPEEPAPETNPVQPIVHEINPDINKNNPEPLVPEIKPLNNPEIIKTAVIKKAETKP